MKHKAVIFDLFGTLTVGFPDTPYRESLRDMADAVGADRTAFAAVWGTAEAFQRRQSGELCSPADNAAWVCEQVGVTPTEAGLTAATEARVDFARTLLVLRDDAVATVRGVKESGRKTALMSVASGEVPELFADLPVAPWFDEALFSSNVHLVKPDVRFYKLASERLGVAAGACLYVGDGACEELAGARRAGMHPVLIRPADEDPRPFGRHEAQAWDGPVVETLTEVLDLLE